MMLALAAVASCQDSTAASPESDSSTPATLVQLPASNPPATPGSFDQVVDRIVEREHYFVAQMRHSHPLVETYIQNMKNDKEMGATPVSDHYFLGRIDLSQGADDRLFLGQPGFGRKMIETITSRRQQCHR